MTATLKLAFTASMLVGLFAIVASIVVRVGLRHRCIRVDYRGTLPMYLFEPLSGLTAIAGQSVAYTPRGVELICVFCRSNWRRN
jgi:hypothetical protein